MFIPGNVAKSYYKALGIKIENRTYGIRWISLAPWHSSTPRCYLKKLFMYKCFWQSYSQRIASITFKIFFIPKTEYWSISSNSFDITCPCWVHVRGLKAGARFPSSITICCCGSSTLCGFLAAPEGELIGSTCHITDFLCSGIWYMTSCSRSSSRSGMILPAFWSTSLLSLAIWEHIIVVVTPRDLTSVGISYNPSIWSRRIFRATIRLLADRIRFRPTQWRTIVVYHNNFNLEPRRRQFSLESIANGSLIDRWQWESERTDMGEERKLYLITYRIKLKQYQKRISFTLSKPSRSEVFSIFLFSVIVVFNQLKQKSPKIK